MKIKDVVMYKTSHSMIAWLTTLVLTFSVQAADQRNFTPKAGGVPPSTPYAWATSGNWEGGTAPSVKSDLAYFASRTGNLFVTLPDAVTIGGLYTSGSGVLYLVGDQLTVDSSGWTGNFGTPTAIPAGRMVGTPYVYADVTAPGKIHGTWQIAGDIRVTTEVTSSSGAQWWRGDWYASSSSETRSAFDIAYVNNSSSSLGFVGTPGAAERTLDGWSLTAGSKLVPFTGSSMGLLSPGCLVSGSGISDGTFLKRCFPNLKLIELSQAATATNPSASLTFAASSPTVTGRIGKLQAAGNGDKTFESYVENDLGALSITINRLQGSESRTATFDGHDYPARLTIGRSDELKGAVIFANKTDFVFTQPSSGIAGVAYAKDVQFTGTGARIAVETGVEAAYSNVTAMAGGLTLTKAGAGSLTLSLGASLTTVSSKLVLSEGTLTLSPLAASTVFADVEVASAQTLKVAAGTAVVTALGENATLEASGGATIDLSAFAAIPSGVKLRGAGRFLVVSLASVEGTDKGVDVVLKLAKEGSVRDIKPTDAIVPVVVGNPAFWVDAGKNVTTITSNGVENCVLSWLDCRATPGSSAYREVYATNDFSQLRGTSSGSAPSRLTTCGGFPALDHSGHTAFGVGTGATNPRWVYSGMTWNRPITNIYAVFSVTYQPSGGGRGQSILGVTRRFDSIGIRNANGESDFARGLNASTDGGSITQPNKSYIFSASASDIVKQGWIYVRGLPRAWNENCYLADSVEIVESHPLAPGGKADAFAMQDGMVANPALQSGLQYHLETIIYTNRLTQAERAQVYAYLSKKYYGEDYNITALGGSRFVGDGNLGDMSIVSTEKLEVDSMLAVNKLSGSGTLVKSGSGTFYADLVEGASLDVKGGTFVVHSATTPTTYAELPAGHFVHLDASNRDSLDLVTVSDTYNDGYEPASEVLTDMVAHWYDARYGNDGIHPYGVPRKSDVRCRTGVLVSDGLNGLPVVDYGPQLTYVSSMHLGRRRYHEIHMTDENVAFPAKPVMNLYMVKNTAAGGNWVMGDPTAAKGIPRSTSSLTDPTVPITTKSMTGSLNGVDIDPTVVGYTGGWDMLALHATDATINGSTFASNGGGSSCGGMKLAEVIVFTNAVSFGESRTIEAYLNKKWFNRTVSYGSPSIAGRVNVASGATVVVEGGAPLSATSVSGAGTIQGSVALASGATLEVYVNEDGSLVLPSSSITGVLDVSAGGTVNVTGYVNKLREGTYPLLTASSVVRGTSWSCVAPGAMRPMKIKAGATSLDLVVRSSGFAIVIR